MRDLYFQEFFRYGNPFLTLGVVWAMAHAILTACAYKPQPTHTRKRDIAFAILFNAVAAGVAAFTGWIALAYMWEINWGQLQWEYLVVAVVAFLATTGVLHRAIMASTFFRGWTPAQHETQSAGRPPERGL